MVYILKVLKLIAVVAIFSSAAFAADSNKFSGPYIAGTASVESNLDIVSVNGIAGYRYQSKNNMVMGIEAGYGSFTESTTSAGRDFSFLDFKHEWSLTALAGLAFGEDNSNLLFGTLGYAGVDFDIVPNQSELGDINEHSKSGGQYGAGYERRFGETVSARMSVSHGKLEGLKRTKFNLGIVLNF